MRHDLSVHIVDLNPGDRRLEMDVLPILKELRPHLTAESFAAVYEEGYSQGLRFTAVYRDESCVGVAGWRLVAMTAHVKKLYVDDLVTTAAARSQGIGKALLDDLLERAKAAQCQVLDLDSGIQRSEAHRFYMRQGLAITSFHFGRLI